MKSIKELLEFSFINIDKPSGPTSFQVSDYVREQLGARKTSHMGTLDPAVSGVLPIALNRACKLSPYLMKKNKSYVGIMRMHEDIDDEKLNKEMQKFVRKIKQMPPVRSSVKRAEREREVYEFNFLEREGKDVLFDSVVEAGTYIRTLINDLGKNIGGAHMLELRRTDAGVFNENSSVNLYELDKAVDAHKKGDETLLKGLLIPAEKVIAKILPNMNIKKDRLKEILTGKPIHIRDLALEELKKSRERGVIVAVFCDGKFVEVARQVLEGEVVAVPEFVLN